jgi:hypothetical protein
LQGNFLTKNNLIVIPYQSYFPLLPRLKIRLKGHHFDTVEVVVAESLVVRKTLTEYGFQDAFKKWQKHWERRICVEGDYFEGDGDK